MARPLRIAAIATWLVASGSLSRAEIAEADVRKFVASSYLLLAHASEAGPVATPVRGGGVVSIERAICQPDAPDVALAGAVGLAEGCLDAEDPAGSPLVLARRAADEVQAWLRSLPADKTGPVEGPLPKPVVQEASARYTATLARLGLPDRLVDAWRRHVVGDSECARALRARMEQMKAGVVLDCNRLPWDSVVDICTSPSRTVIGHIVLRSGVRPVPGPQLAAVESLMGLGLRECLADLVERHGAPELVAGVERHDVDSPDRAGMDLARGVWEIWRAHGVERWLDATMDAGQVPEAVAAALAECTGGGGAAVGARAPALDVATPRGERWTLASSPGRFVVVSFWASWCAPCFEEMRELARVADTLKVEGGAEAPGRLEYVAVNLREKPEEVRATVERPEFGSVSFVFDVEGAAAAAWGVRGLPATYLVGPDGKVLEAVKGYDPELAERVLAAVRGSSGG
jgi:cytochrome c biogenesis protein CcmG/thiol:disulfide interchange protein DsbE